ncbi:hypothetical protein GC197_01710 [bacterium]|nr:hypothetical protein [bacterium]
MDITTALPLGLSAASLATGIAKRATQNVFSLMSGFQSTPPESQPESSTSLDSLLSTSGVLGNNVEDLNKQLEGSLQDLQDLLRRTFHQAGQDLPDSFQLSIDANGEIVVDGKSDFAKVAQGVLSQSDEAQGILHQIATQAAAIKTASDQQSFASDYNQNPEAALNALQQSKEESTGIDINFVDGQPASFQLTSA